MKVLVVAAHPDDEVLGCGATIPRLVGEGHEVEIAILGEGITSRYDDRSEADPAAIERLHAKAREVGKDLGARNVHLFALPDNRFDTVPLLDIVKRVGRLVDAFRPHLVFTQHGGDLNIDHAITYRATLTATRPMAGSGLRGVYAYPVGSSSEWSFQSFAPVFRPSLFVDVTKTLERKVEAMLAYDDEARPFPHPRSAEAIRASARTWGATAGLEAAEAFEVVWETKRVGEVW